jgi:hypothetical protein
MIANSRLKADTFNLPASVSVEEREDEEYFTPEMMMRIDRAFEDIEAGKGEWLTEELKKDLFAW